MEKASGDIMNEQEEKVQQALGTKMSDAMKRKWITILAVEVFTSGNCKMIFEDYAGYAEEGDPPREQVEALYDEYSGQIQVLSESVYDIVEKNVDLKDTGK